MTPANPWQKVPPELVVRFDTALPQATDVQRRQMFGCPCAFVTGNMFVGLHEDRLLVRLPDALHLSAKVMSDWIERGYRHTRAQPPKAPKSAKATSAKKAASAAPPAAAKASAAKAMKATGAAKAAKKMPAKPKH